MWGETYIISKKLKQGEDPIECDCRRSIFATSYIPKTLTSVITEKGVLQRLLTFIWEVPQDVQKKMRRKLIDDFGTIQEREAPKIKYAKSLATIYDTVKERHDEVGGDPLKVLKFSREANDALLRECILMEEYIIHSRPEVFIAVETFINRILKHIQKLAILCSVAEAPSIKDKSKRFVVTAKNVQQAASLVRQCYKSLVSWLDEALRVEKRAVAENANLGLFKAVYRSMDSNDGWVHKALLLKEIRKKTQKGQQTVYNWWKKVEEYFEENKINKSVYVKLKEE
jgi:transposase